LRRRAFLLPALDWTTMLLTSCLHRGTDLLTLGLVQAAIPVAVEAFQDLFP
jgi:hypothetical protein